MSYVAQKTGKSSNLKKKKKHFEDVDPVDPSATTPNELCNSSEDESAFVDHYSDFDEQPCSESFAINHAESTKNNIDSECDDAKKPGSNLDLITQSDVCHKSDKVVHSFYQETEISAGRMDDEVLLTSEIVDSNESLLSEKCLTEVNELKDSESKPTGGDERVEKNNDIDRIETAETTESSSNAIPKILTSECFVPLQSTALSEVNCILAKNSSTTAEDVLDPTRETNNRSEGKVESEAIPQVEENDSPSKASPVPFAIQKSWNRNNVGDVTLAELYLMLGKPGVFKLCYQWRKKDDCESASKPAIEADQKLSSSLTALIQYATLMLTKLNKSSASSNKNQKEQTKNNEKKNENVGVNIGVQCNLLEKVTDFIVENLNFFHFFIMIKCGLQNDQPTLNKSTSANPQSKKSGGKGVKKSSNSSSSSNKTGNTFAVPNIPNRRKRNQSQCFYVLVKLL